MRLRNPSQSGARYFLSIVDDYSRKLWIFIQKTKDGTFKNRKTLLCHLNPVILTMLKIEVNFTLLEKRQGTYLQKSQRRAYINLHMSDLTKPIPNFRYKRTF